MLPNQKIKERLVPYRLLAYLLYIPAASWLEVKEKGVVRVNTADMARFFKLKNTSLWDGLNWLERQELVVSVSKEKKRGYATIILKELSRWN